MVLSDKYVLYDIIFGALDGNRRIISDRNQAKSIGAGPEGVVGADFDIPDVLIVQSRNAVMKVVAIVFEASQPIVMAQPDFLSTVHRNTIGTFKGHELHISRGTCPEFAQVRIVASCDGQPLLVFSPYQIFPHFGKVGGIGQGVVEVAVNAPVIRCIPLA